MDSEPDDDRGSVIAQAVHELLARHGIPERKHLVTLEAALDMAYQQVRRRMSGQTAWTVDEIRRLAEHFGEPLFNLLGALANDPGHPAILQMPGVRMACRIWPGAQTSPAARIGPLVAIHREGNDSWVVVSVADAGDQATYELKRLMYEAAPPFRVAVVEDDEDAGLSIVEFLRLKGLDATLFRSAEAARKALETASFDGFVLDWLLREGSVRDLLPEIRARNPNGPVVILTGQIKAGRAKEDELAQVMTLFRAQLYEKPTRSLSIFHALTLGFERASS